LQAFATLTTLVFPFLYKPRPLLHFCINLGLEKLETLKTLEKAQAFATLRTSDTFPTVSGSPPKGKEKKKKRKYRKAYNALY
jgi:hypothetical protein